MPLGGFEETERSDNSSDSLSKDVSLKLMADQRVGTPAALEQLSDRELEKPAFETIKAIVTTVAHRVPRTEHALNDACRTMGRCAA